MGKIVYKCRECDSENVFQQITHMIGLNCLDDSSFISLSDCTFDDFFWCEDCEDDCKVIETEEK